MEISNNKPKLLKSDTRQWNSGRVKFSVIGWPDKPDRNYIIFEKDFTGKSSYPDQRFNFRFTDWENLKKLIDVELSSTTGWEKTIAVIDEGSLKQFIESNPDSIGRILSNQNILKLSDSSFESLDKIAITIYEIKADKIDLLFKKISDTSATDLNQFCTLLNDLKLNQISMMTSLVYQKLKIIDLLEKTIIDSRNKESDIHHIFENNPWLLGRNFEIISSDKPLTEYLSVSVQDDPETKKRPDIIAKTIPYSNNIVVIELKAPGIKLKADHIGQVLNYKALIMKHKPNAKNIDCFVFGYEKSDTFISSKDAVIKTFSELVAELRDEYREYQKVLELGKEVENI